MAAMGEMVPLGGSRGKETRRRDPLLPGRFGGPKLDFRGDVLLAPWHTRGLPRSLG